VIAWIKRPKVTLKRKKKTAIKAKHKVKKAAKPSAAKKVPAPKPATVAA
jgi:hypothetical protein